MEGRMIWMLCLLELLGFSSGIQIGRPVPEGSFNADNTLVFLQTVWRHGDRDAQYTFPTDKATWKHGWGELTTLGMKQHVVLGQRLNQRYTVDIPNFMTGGYNNTHIYIRSTDVNRTILSAISNTIGFFKGTPGEDYPQMDAWPKNYVPVPIHTPAHYDEDYVGNPYRVCKRSDAIQKFVQDSPEVSKIFNANKAFLNTMSNITKKKLDLWNVWTVYDTWFIDREYKKDLPDAFKNETLFNQTRDLTFLMDNVEFGIGFSPYKKLDVKTEWTKLRGGPLLQSIIEHIQAKITCTTKPETDMSKSEQNMCRWMKPLKYFAYSGHDATIASLFATFDFNETNFDEPGFPHYSACVSIELWKDPKSNYYVKVYYWVPPVDLDNPDIDQKLFVDLTDSISGCKAECDLDSFVNRSKKYLLDTSPEELCENTKLTNSGALTCAANVLLLVSLSSIIHYLI